MVEGLLPTGTQRVGRQRRCNTLVSRPRGMPLDSPGRVALLAMRSFLLAFTFRVFIRHRFHSRSELHDPPETQPGRAFSDSYSSSTFKHFANLIARTGSRLQIFSSVCWLIPRRMNSRFGMLAIRASCSSSATALL